MAIARVLSTVGVPLLYGSTFSVLMISLDATDLSAILVYRI